MDIHVNYSYVGAVLTQNDSQSFKVQGDCFETDIGRVMMFLDTGIEGGSNQDFLSIFRLSEPLANLDKEWLTRLGNMIDNNLVHVLEIIDTCFIDDALLAFCKKHDIGFSGPIVECDDNVSVQSDTGLQTRFFAPLEDVSCLISHVKEGNFLVEAGSQLFCSSKCANSLLKAAFRLEENPLFGKKGQKAYLLRLLNVSPFSVSMQLASKDSRTQAPAPFVLRPNGRRLLNVDGDVKEQSRLAPGRWAFDWLNVRQFDGDRITASLEAVCAA